MMRKMFEEQLLRAKKLEGIGQLVSSVVHDYNNILGVILGHGELLRKTLKEEGSARVSLEAILNATRKGTDLARQLLDFGEEGAVTTRAVDVNKVIKSMEDMFLKTIGEKIGLDIIPLKDLWLARVDPIHLYEMLINLATNARDAIVEGPGTLLIKTSNVVVDENFVATHSGFSAGEYVMITFSDNGMGMDKKTRGRIFEPFFTTKDEEHSPGLGLAAVYGMVKRNGGGITVRSTPGDGTTFCIYLPRFDAETSGNPDEAIPNERLRSDKTILVVEDQTDLLGVIKHDLEEYGYRVLSAPGPEEALDICEEYPGEIDLLLSDVILPGINGRELSDKIADILPNIKTVFMSGYSSGTLKVEGVIDDMAHFLQKPFTSYELGRKMFKVISVLSVT
jgi:nitrogen-specific signal transduction histidine kinase